MLVLEYVMGVVVFMDGLDFMNIVCEVICGGLCCDLVIDFWE